MNFEEYFEKLKNIPQEYKGMPYFEYLDILPENERNELIEMHLNVIEESKKHGLLRFAELAIKYDIAKNLTTGEASTNKKFFKRSQSIELKLRFDIFETLIVENTKNIKFQLEILNIWLNEIETEIDLPSLKGHNMEKTKYIKKRIKLLIKKLNQFKPIQENSIKIYEKIDELISNISPLKWEKVFYAKTDYIEYKEILMKFLTDENYIIPTKIIKIKKRSKTSIIGIFKKLHDHHSVFAGHMKEDTHYFDIVRILSEWQHNNNDQIYKRILSNSLK